MGKETPLTTGELEKFAELLERFELTRLEYENGDVRVVLEKAPAPVSHPSQSLRIPQHMPQTDHPANPPQAQQAPVMADTTETARAKHMISAPLVGIAYRAKEPGATPFVTVGDTVEEGAVLCLIEAMKMFNEIKAPAAGTVTGIHFEDAKLVEYGAPLISLD